MWKKHLAAQSTTSFLIHPWSLAWHIRNPSMCPQKRRFLLQKPSFSGPSESLNVECCSKFLSTGCVICQIALKICTDLHYTNIHLFWPLKKHKGLMHHFDPPSAGMKRWELPKPRWDFSPRLNGWLGYIGDYIGIGIYGSFCYGRGLVWVFWIIFSNAYLRMNQLLIYNYTN